MKTLCYTTLILTLMLPPLHAFDGPAASPEKELELLAVLRSDAAPADKAIACKNLAIYGSSESVA